MQRPRKTNTMIIYCWQFFFVIAFLRSFRFLFSLIFLSSWLLLPSLTIHVLWARLFSPIRWSIDSRVLECLPKNLDISLFVGVSSDQSALLSWWRKSSKNRHTPWLDTNLSRCVLYIFFYFYLISAARGAFPLISRLPPLCSLSFPTHCNPSKWLFYYKIRGRHCTWWLRCSVDGHFTLDCGDTKWDHRYDSIICYQLRCP